MEPPVVCDEDRFFWEGVSRGELLVRECGRCRRLQHPPSPLCPGCGSSEWSERRMSGRGTVHSWIVSRHPTEPDDSPRITAVIALEDGPRFVSNLLGTDPDDVTDDMPVRLVFAEVDGVLLPQFEAAPPS